MSSLQDRPEENRDGTVDRVDDILEQLCLVKLLQLALLHVVAELSQALQIITERRGEVDPALQTHPSGGAHAHVVASSDLHGGKGLHLQLQALEQGRPASSFALERPVLACLGDVFLALADHEPLQRGLNRVVDNLRDDRGARWELPHDPWSLVGFTFVSAHG